MGGIGGGDAPGGPTGLSSGDSSVGALAGGIGPEGLGAGLGFGTGPGASASGTGPAAGDFGGTPGALSNLGEVTPSSVFGAIAEYGIPIAAGIFGGPLLGMAASLAASALTGNFGKGLASMPGQIVGMGANAISKGVGYGLPGLIASGLANSLVGDNRGGGQPPGDTSGMGVGVPDIGMLADAIMGQGVARGAVPGVGMVRGGAPQAVAPQGPSPVMGVVQPQLFGMKRVNMPWEAWPASRTQYTGGNYGGMKRVG